MISPHPAKFNTRAKEFVQKSELKIINEWGGDRGDTRAKVGTRGSSLLQIYPYLVDATQGSPCCCVTGSSDIFMGRERLMLCGNKDCQKIKIIETDEEKLGAPLE
jgi:hypothetical protein